ncbi:hypothetical protein [Streptomyces sp. TS71-3]|uniref:hypothetical protein n=1 Tax=Streptomyces sp. TS71-3 TaxID=2733862 RepID=UPI001B10B795|nr:hypothetical protein [Streptomyces sp. TS71-3]GHJ42636.1 hypothetical protein Sm713_82450 [Streptomyces sp. TS71-3]
MARDIRQSAAQLLDPEMTRSLWALVDRAERDERLQVIVFDSADPDYFIAHFDVARAAELPTEPGPTGLPVIADIAVRMTKAPFITIASIRGRARRRKRVRALVRHAVRQP